MLFIHFLTFIPSCKTPTMGTHLQQGPPAHSSYKIIKYNLKGSYKGVKINKICEKKLKICILIIKSNILDSEGSVRMNWFYNDVYFFPVC